MARFGRLAALGTLLAGAACGGGGTGGGSPGAGGPLTGTPPLPEHLTLNDHVRTIVVRTEDRAGADRRATQCGVSALLFDVVSTSTVMVEGRDDANDCRLYGTAPETDYQRQRWICAGALIVGNATVTVCPHGTGPVMYDQPLSDCALGTSVMLTSDASAVPGAVLPDLSATVAFPGPVAITGPSDLSTTTWPTSGDLTVTWTSADATSAVVRLDVVDSPTPSIIVCRAHTNGRVTVSADLVNQGLFRTHDTRVQVWSYRDGTTTAEMGKTYRIAGARGSNLLLQRRP